MMYMIGALAAAAILALDQWVKHWITVNLPLGESMPLLPGFMQLRTVHQNFHIVRGVAEEFPVFRLLKQHRIRPAHAALQIAPVHFLRHRRRPAGPLLLDSLGYLFHLGRRGAGTDGVGKNVHLGKAALPDEV